MNDTPSTPKPPQTPSGKPVAAATTCSAVPFECDNCGAKPSSGNVIRNNGSCLVCGDKIVTFTVDAAMVIEKLKNDATRLQWILDNASGELECCENVTGNPERYYIELSRDAIDREISKPNDEGHRSCDNNT